MISSQLLIEIYLSFVFMGTLPWILNWASRGTMPVTVRLYAMFTFSMFLVESGWTLWTVHAEAPDRMGDAVRLLAPIIFASFLGMNFVAKSLIKMVAASIKHSDETN